MCTTKHFKGRKDVLNDNRWSKTGITQILDDRIQECSRPSDA